MSGYLGPLPVPQATQHRLTVTATAGLTTITTTGYQPGFVDVYLNGVKLIDGDDYTASNGSSITLTSGASAGDSIEIIANVPFGVVNDAINTKSLQIGQSATATNNFTLQQPSTPDGTVRLSVGNAGATTKDAIVVTNEGHVGLGTPSPDRALVIASPTSPEMSFKQTNAKANGRVWNFLANGGNAATNSDFYLRLLNDAGTSTQFTAFMVNGTTGQFSTGVPNGISPASVPSGSVIQTAWNNLGNGSWSATTATLTYTGFNVPFTPKLNTSKVLHIVTIGALFNCDGQLRIGRGGTWVSPNLQDSFREYPASWSVDMPVGTFTWLDSPNTASAITYGLWSCATGCGSSAFVGTVGDQISSWIVMEIAA